jgi:RNA polymerase sigma factor (TIGR02999 family)
MRERDSKTVMGSENFLGEVSQQRISDSSDGANPPQRSLDEVFSLAYEELRRLARSVRRSDPRASLTPTTIVNEAWMKLARTPAVAASSPLHFRRIAACAMRQVLVDAARRRQAQIRGGDVQRVTFDESSFTISTDREMLALDAAIDALAKAAPRQAALVEARFFGGLETSEIAQLLGISEATVLRDWRAAKAWLAAEVRRDLA